MTAGRKPTPFVPQDKPVIDAEAIHGAMIASALAGQAAQAAEHEETLDLGKIIGRIEAADFFSNICDSIKLAAFESAKKSKAYKNFTNPKTKMHFSSCAEFCEVALGATYQRFHQLAQNRNTVGQELFEKSEKIGLRQVDYNALKAMPAEEQAVIKQAIDQGESLDSVLVMFQDFAARSQRQREALNKKLEDTEASLVAARRVVGEKETTITGLQEKLALDSGKKKPTPEFIADSALRDLDNESLRLMGLIEASLRSYLVKVVAPELDLADLLRQQAIRAAVGRVLAATHQLAQDFDVPVSGPTAAHENGETDEVWAATLNEIVPGDDDVSGS